MLLDLTQIRALRSRVERMYPASAFDTSQDDFSIAGEVQLAFDVEKQDDRFRLTGTVRAPLELPCSRCLEPMLWPIEASFDLHYLPASSNTGEGESEIAAEDLGVAYYEGDTIDLRHLIREQFYLSLPMKPLCRTGCAGLCPECGANLNVAACACEHRWVDPRMAALEQLLPKTKPE